MNKIIIIVLALMVLIAGLVHVYMTYVAEKTIEYTPTETSQAQPNPEEDIVEIEPSVKSSVVANTPEPEVTRTIMIVEDRHTLSNGDVKSVIITGEIINETITAGDDITITTQDGEFSEKIISLHGYGRKSFDQAEPGERVGIEVGNIPKEKIAKNDVISLITQ